MFCALLARSQRPVAVAYPAPYYYVSPLPGATTLAVPFDALAANSFDPDTPLSSMVWRWSVSALPNHEASADPLLGGVLQLTAEVRKKGGGGSFNCVNFPSNPLLNTPPCLSRLQFNDYTVSNPFLFLGITGGAAGNVEPLLSFNFIVTLSLSDGCTFETSSVVVILSCAADLSISAGPVALQVRNAMDTYGEVRYTVPTGVIPRFTQAPCPSLALGVPSDRVYSGPGWSSGSIRCSVWQRAVYDGISSGSARLLCHKCRAYHRHGPVERILAPDRRRHPSSGDGCTEVLLDLGARALDV